MSNNDDWGKPPSDENPWDQPGQPSPDPDRQPPGGQPQPPGAQPSAPQPPAGQTDAPQAPGAQQGGHGPGPQPSAPQPGYGQPQPQDPQLGQAPGPQAGGPEQQWGQPPQNQDLQKAGGSTSKLDSSDIVVLVLSFFFPGVGHMMLGQTKKGLVILGAVILSCGIGYAVNLLIVADAFLCAMTKKERALEDWEFFPNYQRYL